VFAECLLQTLLAANDVVQPPPRKRRRTDAGSLSLDSLQEVAAFSSALNAAFHPHLVQTLSKWSAKVQAVAPSVLLPSSRTSFSRSSAANALRSAPALIDDALAGPAGEKLLARTRIRRGKAGRVGGAGAGAVAVGEEDAEGFDDADFYQQLLRDVIDARAGAEGGSGGGEAEWLAAQRSRKAKKVVDTKASKGRRLRYEVHEKLQNFMVPVPVPGQWHEQQIDELFASLLGRGFEHATAGADEDEGGGVQMEVGQDGFRVFG
jgi:protein AATF/BFR2